MSFELDDDEELQEAHDNRKRRCSSCNAYIIWFVTDKGRNMPVDADTVEAEDQEYHPPRHVSHFATCPNANQHRKRG